MFSSEDQVTLKKTAQTANSFLIILCDNPTLDQVASSLSLALSLEQLNKRVHLVCKTSATETWQKLVGAHKITDHVGNQSLDICFDYHEEMVENVSYSIDQDQKKFHLIVKPKRGQPGLDPQSVKYSQVGIDADVIFMIGISAYSQISSFYEQDEPVFIQAETIAITPMNTTFARHNLNISQFAACSESIYMLLKLWEVSLSADVATNLLAGIESATDSFRHASVTAHTFQTVAELMKSGAKRVYLASSSASTTSQLAAAFASKSSSSVVVQSAKQLQQLPSDHSPLAR